jgi:hypothetical protein
MRIFLFCVVSLLSVPAASTPLCEGVILQPDSIIMLHDSKPSTDDITVHVRTPSVTGVLCPPIPRNLRRMVQRHIRDLSQLEHLTTDRLIGFIASPWRTLSNSAGQKLSKQILQGTQRLSAAHLLRLTRLVTTNQVGKVSGQMIVRILSKLPEAQAVHSLGSILKQSTRLSVQRSAARSLGRFPSNDAQIALKTCARGVDRMLSARCERSLVRWATQQTPSSKTSQPNHPQSPPTSHP